LAAGADDVIPVAGGLEFLCRSTGYDGSAALTAALDAAYNDAATMIAAVSEEHVT
jgi:hypothetical protein